jgi:hypothetical protein
MGLQSQNSVNIDEIPPNLGRAQAIYQLAVGTRRDHASAAQAATSPWLLQDRVQVEVVA